MVGEGAYGCERIVRGCGRSEPRAEATLTVTSRWPGPRSSGGMLRGRANIQPGYPDSVADNKVLTALLSKAFEDDDGVTEIFDRTPAILGGQPNSPD